jgi:hypothetical protein
MYSICYDLLAFATGGRNFENIKKEYHKKKTKEGWKKYREVKKKNNKIPTDEWNLKADDKKKLPQKVKQDLESQRQSRSHNSHEKTKSR